MFAADWRLLLCPLANAATLSQTCAPLLCRRVGRGERAALGGYGAQLMRNQSPTIETYTPVGAMGVVVHLEVLAGACALWPPRQISVPLEVSQNRSFAACFVGGACISPLGAPIPRHAAAAAAKPHKRARPQATKTHRAQAQASGTMLGQAPVSQDRARQANAEPCRPHRPQ